MPQFGLQYNIKNTYLLLFHSRDIYYFLNAFQKMDGEGRFSKN